MGLFGNIFGGGNEGSNNGIEWSVLNSVDQLDSIIEESAEKPVVIFKHSTRCSISDMALSRVKEAGGLERNPTVYYLDLIRFRNVSNEIASRYDVTHASPQTIIVKDGKAVDDLSHFDITADNLNEILTA